MLACCVRVVRIQSYSLVVQSSNWMDNKEATKAKLKEQIQLAGKEEEEEEEERMRMMTTCRVSCVIVREKKV